VDRRFFARAPSIGALGVTGHDVVPGPVLATMRM